MNQEPRKIRSFTDLDAWREGHKLVILIYKLTDKFPKSEQFSLSNQMRRAAVSITSNIAEGFSRRSYKDKVKFYHISLGSLTEIQNQMLIARDLGHIAKNDFANYAKNTVTVSKLINGLIKGAKSIIHNS